jgi:hypothetical protein
MFALGECNLTVEINHLLHLPNSFLKQNRYKDPLRGDANFQTMMAEKADAEERAANPKPGSAPGCPGCKN